MRLVIVEYGYSILVPICKRTFVKWCFLEKKKIFLPISIIPNCFSLRRRALLDRVAVLGICCLESRIAAMICYLNTCIHVKLAEGS